MGDICKNKDRNMRKADDVQGLQLIEYDSLEECAYSVKEYQRNQPINPFFTYEWLSLWKKYFAPEDKEKILVFLEQGEIVGFLPFVYRRNRYLATTVYRLFGTHKSNYLSIPVKGDKKKEIYEEVFRYFKEHRGGAILQIEDINDSSLDYSILSEKLHECLFMQGHQFYQYSCPYAIMDGSWEVFFKRHYKKSKRRSKMKSFETKLERIGEVQFIRIRDLAGYEAYKELLEQTFAIHRLRFRNEWNSSMYSDDQFSGFYRELFHEYARLGLLDMTMLCIDSIVVSFILALKQDGSLIHYVPGYHIAFQCFSLGHVHLMKLFQSILDEKEIACFDFSLGTQEYKERWADGYTSNHSFLFRFGSNPFVWITAFGMKQLTTLKLFGRKKGWNEKIRRMLAKVRNRKFAQGFKDEEGVLVNCPAESIHPTSEKGYTLKELLSFPLNIQTFVIEQIYSGKEIIFLYEEKTIVGVKTKDEQGESTYKLILKE